MALNTDPVHVKLQRINWTNKDGDSGSAGPLKTANTAMDGSGTTLTVFTADATNGSWVTSVTLTPAGTNVASLVRIFLNDGTSQTVGGTHSVLIKERGLAATTLSQTVSMNDIIIPINKFIPAGYKLQIALGTTVAAGYYAFGEGGDF